MKKLPFFFLAFSLTATGVLAQPRPLHPPVRHAQPHLTPRTIWKKGGTISRSDWRRGQKVDYRRVHLKRPARGYEWRRVGDFYVLAFIKTGRISSVIAAR